MNGNTTGCSAKTNTNHLDDLHMYRKKASDCSANTNGNELGDMHWKDFSASMNTNQSDNVKNSYIFTKPGASMTTILRKR